MAEVLQGALYAFHDAVLLHSSLRDADAGAVDCALREAYQNASYVAPVSRTELGELPHRFTSLVTRAEGFVHMASPHTYDEFVLWLAAGTVPPWPDGLDVADAEERNAVSVLHRRWVRGGMRDEIADHLATAAPVADAAARIADWTERAHRTAARLHDMAETAGERTLQYSADCVEDDNETEILVPSLLRTEHFPLVLRAAPSFAQVVNDEGALWAYVTLPAPMGEALRLHPDARNHEAQDLTE